MESQNNPQNKEYREKNKSSSQKSFWIYVHNILDINIKKGNRQIKKIQTKKSRMSP